MGKMKNSSKNNNSFRDELSQMFSYLSSDPVIPPCSKYLGNRNPILSGCMWLYRNDNRVYSFLSTRPENTNEKTTLFTNLQINFSNFIIGLYINSVQNDNAYYDPKVKIHTNKNINKMIHQLLKNKDKINLPFIPRLRLVVSNSNAILPLLNFSEQISEINYIVIFVLHSIEKHPGLAFGNNNYILNNYINQLLASLNISLPLDKLKI